MRDPDDAWIGAEHEITVKGGIARVVSNTAQERLTSVSRLHVAESQRIQNADSSISQYTVILREALKLHGTFRGRCTRVQPAVNRQREWHGTSILGKELSTPMQY